MYNNYTLYIITLIIIVPSNNNTYMTLPLWHYQNKNVICTFRIWHFIAGVDSSSYLTTTGLCIFFVVMILLTLLGFVLVILQRWILNFEFIQMSLLQFQVETPDKLLTTHRPKQAVHHSVSISSWVPDKFVEHIKTKENHECSFRSSRWGWISEWEHNFGEFLHLLSSHFFIF